jgi:hypothetical protein
VASFERVLARLRETATKYPSTSALFVLQRMAATFVPRANTTRPPYTSNSCHAQVAKAVLKRGNPEDRIYLFGTDSEVMHSVLTDENNRVLVDAWSGRFTPTKYITQTGENLDLVYTCQVSDIFDMYQL